MMVSRVFEWYQLKPVLITIPSFLVSLCAFIARLVTNKPYINSASFKRINETESTIRNSANCLLASKSFTPRSPSDLLHLTSFAKRLNTAICCLSSLLPK